MLPSIAHAVVGWLWAAVTQCRAQRPAGQLWAPPLACDTHTAAASCSGLPWPTVKACGEGLPMGHGQTGWKGWVAGYGVQGRGGGWTVPGRHPCPSLSSTSHPWLPGGTWFLFVEGDEPCSRGAHGKGAVARCGQRGCEQAEDAVSRCETHVKRGGGSRAGAQQSARTLPRATGDGGDTARTGAAGHAPSRG